MKMETVKAHLDQWGEIMITTNGGKQFELHIGDTEFNFEERLIRLKTPNSIHIIDGDSVESIEMHYGHVSE